jgi:glucokinase
MSSGRRDLILAGDIGATKTRLGIFTHRNPSPLAAATYATAEFAHPAELIDSFLSTVAMRPPRAVLGVAGVVVGRRVPRINLPWDIDADVLEREVGLRDVTLANDVEANAQGILALSDHDFTVLHPGAADAKGTQAVVSAGTGLGEAALWWDGARHHPAASEGGSAAFGPSSKLEVELHRFLADEQGRVNWGHVCSGPGLRNIYRFLAGGGDAPAPAAIAAAAEDDPESVAHAAVDLFISIYGARAGDVALSFGATGGVYLGGGIAPKLLPQLLEGGFMRAFLAKGRLESLVRRIPVRVVLNADAALIGAALYAKDAAESEPLAA